MIAVVMAIVLLTGSLCLMIGAIVENQIHPRYGSALTIPIVNFISMIPALLGLGVSVVAYQKNKGMKLAKRTMVLGIVCVVILVLLLPLSDMGYLSKVR
jgi:hypothetical protein